MSDDKIYLEFTNFREYGDYAVEITSSGLTIYSECCSDNMSDETARKVLRALTDYFKDKDDAV